MKLRTLLVTVLLAGGSLSLTAQDFDFGIKFGPSMNWIGTNNLDNDYFRDGFFGGAAYNGLVNGVSDPTAEGMRDRSLSNFRGTLGFYSSLRFGNAAVQVELLVAAMGGRDERTITNATFFSTTLNNGDGAPTYLQQNDGVNPTGTANVGLNEKVIVRYENAYVQIPILFRYEFLKVAKPFLLTGPSIGIRAFTNQWNDRVLVSNNNNNYDTDSKGVNLADVGTENAILHPIRTDMNGVDVGWIFAAGLRLPVVEFELRYNLGLTNFATFQERVNNNEIGGLRNRSLSLLVGFNLTGPR